MAVPAGHLPKKGFVNRLAKIGLAVGGAVAAAGALRRALEPRPRYAPWEKPPYGEFPNKVLVLGGGFGGYTAAQTLCNLVRDRDDVGVMVISRDNFFTFWPMVPEAKLTFVVIGGGATGIEVASEIHALVHEALAPDYPNIDPNRVRIVLLEAGTEILKELDPALRRAARTELVARRIEVMTRVRAKEVAPDCVMLDDGRKIGTENVVWTAGNRPNAKLKNLDLPLTRRDGVIADEYLRVPYRPNVWAIGDSAAIPHKDG